MLIIFQSVSQYSQIPESTRHSTKRACEPPLSPGNRPNSQLPERFYSSRMGLHEFHKHFSYRKSSDGSNTKRTCQHQHTRTSNFGIQSTVWNYTSRIWEFSSSPEIQS